MTEQEVEPIWGGTVDENRFTAQVTPDPEDAYRGKFTITVTESGEVLLDEEVPVAYGAPFGPDVADVMAWQNRTIEVVDAWLVEHGETPPQEPPTSGL